MEFFDDLLQELQDCLKGFTPVSLNSGKLWQDTGRNGLVLERDMAYEIDGIGFNLVTSKPIGGDEVLLFGKDLNRITDEKKLFRISVIQMDAPDGEQQAYNLIRKIEYAKYHYFPKGYMIRTASTTHQETVRVAKTALKEGISLEGVGRLLIAKYKENPAVKAVKVIYINEKSVDFDRLSKISEKNYSITEALNSIMNNITFDCAACNLKPICDEVEGMRELHFKTSGMG